MTSLFEQLQQYRDVMDLHPPVKKETGDASEGKIPEPLMKLYRVFNGGEIFVPGTRILGLTGEGDDILAFDDSDTRAMFAIPASYLIFAKLNFGDFICINRDAPYDLIQWDHENNEEYDHWDSLKAWLEETIRDYEEDSGGTRDA